MSKASNLLLGMLLLWSTGFIAAPAAARQQESATQESAAALALHDLEGRPQDLRQYLGGIVVISFWATWCLPCREEMPILVRTKERYASRGVEIVAASTDDESAGRAVARFARRQRLSFPVWVGATVEDMERFGLGDELPATVIVASDGTIAFRIRGVVREEDLAARIEYLQGEQTGPAPPTLVQDDEHEDEEEHDHGGVGMEGASLVPS